MTQDGNVDESLHLHISSNNSRDIFTSNTPYHFVFELPPSHALISDAKSYSVALKSIVIPNTQPIIRSSDRLCVTLNVIQSLQTSLKQPILNETLKILDTSSTELISDDSCVFWNAKENLLDWFHTKNLSNNFFEVRVLNSSFQSLPKTAEKHPQTSITLFFRPNNQSAMPKVEDQFTLYVSSVDDISRHQNSRIQRAKFRWSMPASLVQTLQTNFQARRTLTDADQIPEFWKIALTSMHFPGKFMLSSPILDPDEYFIYISFFVDFLPSGSKFFTPLKKITFTNFPDEEPSMENILSYLEDKINELVAIDLISTKLLRKCSIQKMKDFENQAQKPFKYTLGKTNRVYLSLRKDTRIYISPNLGDVFGCFRDELAYTKSVSRWLYKFGAGLTESQHFQLNLPPSIKIADYKVKKFAAFQDMWQYFRRQKTPLHEFITRMIDFLQSHEKPEEFDLSMAQIINYYEYANGQFGSRIMLPIGRAQQEMNKLIPSMVYLHSNLVESSLVESRFQSIIKAIPFTKSQSWSCSHFDFYGLNPSILDSNDVLFEFKDQNNNILFFDTSDSIKRETLLNLQFHKYSKGCPKNV